MPVEQLSKRMEINGISEALFSDGGCFTAIKDASPDVNNDESLVVLGPGCCGGTVLSSIIVGLEQQTGGTVVYSSKEWKGVDSEISMVSQRLVLMPFKMVVEGVELGLRLCGMFKGQYKELAQHCIELVGFKGLEKSYPTQLSGGMKQRVGIARAYAADPRLLIMDGPSGQLDTQTRYQMQEEILRIQEKEKRTVIFAANNTEEACYSEDRVILLSDCPATVKEIYPISIPGPRDMISEKFLKLCTTISGNTDLAI